MSPQEIKAALLEELGKIAPEWELESIPPEADLREELDLDSVDFLNWMAALHRRVGVAIPELDYPKLRTLDEAVSYLSTKLER
jgi:acyl carrier protein